MKKFTPFLVIAFVAVLGVSTLVQGYSGEAPNVVVEGDYIEAPTEQSLGAFPGGDIYSDVNVYGTLRGQMFTESYAPTATTTTFTLKNTDSGKTYLLSATGTTITLPAVADAGVNFTFKVNGAIDTANVVVDSAEGDNIEGTLIVAGAVVDCDAEDQINFVADGENIGDYFEIMSDGTQWLLGDSGALTASKLTCTDPS